MTMSYPMFFISTAATPALLESTAGVKANEKRSCPLEDIALFWLATCTLSIITNDCLFIDC